MEPANVCSAYDLMYIDLASGKSLQHIVNHTLLHSVSLSHSLFPRFSVCVVMVFIKIIITAAAVVNAAAAFSSEQPADNRERERVMNIGGALCVCYYH